MGGDNDEWFCMAYGVEFEIIVWNNISERAYRLAIMRQQGLSVDSCIYPMSVHDCTKTNMCKFIGDNMIRE